MPPKLKIKALTANAKRKQEKEDSKKEKDKELRKIGRLTTRIASTTAERDKLNRQSISSIHNKNQQIIQNLPEVELDYLVYKPLNRNSMENMSVVNVNKKLTNNNYISTVKDFRFGTLENNVLCGCCKKTNQDCVGHMGHIDLKEKNFSIINPFFRHNVIRVLQCVCSSCGALLAPKELLRQKNILDMPDGIDKIKEIVNLSKNMSCSSPRCKNDKNAVKYCFKIADSGNTNDLNVTVFDKDTCKKPKQMSINKVRSILSKISDEDAKILGFSYGVKPIDYIMDYIPVIPLCSRPYTFRDDAEKDEYLTIAYNEICSKLEELDRIDDNEELIEEKKKSILYFYTHICDNKDGTHRLSPGDICKSIGDRITGKDGLLRGHLLGKRSDYTGRTPIGPNRTLKFGDIAPPMAMQSILTIPEIITKYNINRIQKLLEQNRIDKYSKKGSFNLKYNYNPKMKVKLEIGDLVYRYSMDGDIILFNRQPTLHKQSMLGYFCKFQDKYSIGMHLSSTTGHNADFDGDEGNIHMLQTIESQIEGKIIMCAKNCIMSSNSSSPIASIIFNSLSGAYLLSNVDILDEGLTDLSSIVKGKLFNEGLSKIITRPGYKQSLYDRALDVSTHIGIKITAGKLLCSALLPEDFWYNKKDVKIIKGILIKGTLKKGVLGNAHGSIIQTLFKFYGKTVTSDFISDANFLFNWYLEIYGLTVSVNNCKSPIGFNELKTNIINDLNDEVISINKQNMENVEVEATAIIEERKGRLDKKIKESLESTNPLVIMAESGAKGKTADIGKLIGLLGQQFVNGRRPDKMITNNKRWLTTFSVNDNSIYSRGFAANSFYQGLNPDEFFAHAQASRIGLTDTAVKTSDIGAIQRKMVKAQEDLIVNYDGSVRNQNGIIYQTIYGVGLNCENMIMSKDGNGNSLLSFIDIREVTGRMNQDFNYLEDLESTIHSILNVQENINETEEPEEEEMGINNLAENFDEEDDQ